MPIARLILTVTVAEVFNPVFSIIAVSCGRGKLSSDAVPPDDGAQAVPVQLPPADKFQYTVLGVLNVIPEQPV